MTDTPNKAIAALCKAQAEMTRAMKDAANPFFNSKYADLTSVQDACFPALHANGFAVIHHIGRDENGSFLDTILMHESGTSWHCPVPLRVDKENMQGLGSAITYARRYGLMCVSGVAPEDDDGNKAAASPPKRENGSRVIDSEPSAPERQAILNDIAIENLESCETTDALVLYWKGLPGATQKAPQVLAAKNQMKAKLQEEVE